MAQIMMPQKKPDQTGQMLQLGGMAAGAYFGGPAGAAMGSQVGGAVGGLAQNDKQPPSITAPQQSSALMRRQQQMETDNVATLQKAQQAVASLPEPMRQQYLPPLVQAQMLEQKQRGYV